MVWEKLKEELIIPGLEAKSSDDIFEALGGKLVKQGYCKESYVQALKDREAEFPTGINTGEKGVAIPHTDVSHVNKKGIAIATLKQPVEFVEMGTDDEYVNAQVIFMLAVDEKGHLELLQAILAVLQDQEVLKKLIKAKDAKEIIEIIKEKENIIMKKKVIVACGGAVATSTIAANAIVELAKENNIDIEIAQVRISEIASNLPADLIVTTSKVKRDFGVPLITGMPFVSGLGVDKTKAKILEVLNK